MRRLWIGAWVLFVAMLLSPAAALAQGTGKAAADKDKKEAEAEQPMPPKPPPPPAPKKRQGPEDVQKARSLFKAGARAFDAGRFIVAAKLFDQAYDAAARPALRFSAAQALRNAYVTTRDIRQLKRALAYYQQYVSEVKQGRRVRDATDGIAEIELLLAKASVNAEDNPPQPTPQIESKTVGTLQLDSETPGAVASIVGQPPIDELPHWADLAPGQYQVKLSAKGYKDSTRTVKVTAGRITVVMAKLDEQPAKLQVNTDDGADLLLDGRAVGRAPLTAPLELSSGPHRLVVGTSGYEVETVELDLKRGSSQAVDVELDMTTQRISAWVVLSGAIAAGATAVGLTVWGVVEQSSANRIKERAEDEGRAMTLDEGKMFNGHLATRTDARNLAGSAYVLTGLAGGIALLLFELDGADLYEAATRDGPIRDKSPEDTPKQDDDSLKMELKASAAPLLNCQGTRSACGGMLMLQGRF